LKRHDLSDEEWRLLEPLLPSSALRRVGRWADHRAVIDGVFFRTRTSTPWRDLPPVYGSWKTVYNRHRRWSLGGTWEDILDGLRAGCDVAEGLGRSRGGLSTKIHLVADRRCRPITRLTSPGQHGDCPRFIPLMDTIGIQRGGRGRPPISTWPGLCPAQTISGSGMVASIRWE
jgi:transposase